MTTIPLKLKQNIGVTLSAIALLSPIPCYALTVQEVPNPRQTNGGWVTDSANILSDRTENRLNQIISQLESENGTEIAVVTVPQTSPSRSPKEFATELFNYWGIGKSDRDNGILLLISVGDRRTEIETGYGIESILPDAKVGNIIDTQITPYFKQKNFDKGTLAGTQALIDAVEASENHELKKIRISSDSLQDRNIPTENSGNLTSLIILILSPALVIYLLLRLCRVYVRPEEVRKRIKGNGGCPVFCATCKQKMERIYKHQVDKELSKPEKIAQKIGSVKFEGWKCPKCSHHPVIIGYTPFFSQFRTCHNCHELTVTHIEKMLKYPTRYGYGKRLVTDKCHCCGYYQEKQVTIPCLPSPPPSRSSDNNTWISSNWNSNSNLSSSSSYYDSSSGSSYSGSSGGDFGGGSSGGGGAGGRW
ncbi:MAG: TPM domain-containing protein [Hydrococcus sp. CRU_1_1]|nr:TPM domain-containing protein [Hydrococcus sp. CRU_1_1]